MLDEFSRAFRSAMSLLAFRDAFSSYNRLAFRGPLSERKEACPRVS